MLTPSQLTDAPDAFVGCQRKQRERLQFAPTTTLPGHGVEFCQSLCPRRGCTPFFAAYMRVPQAYTTPCILHFYRFRAGNQEQQQLKEPQQFEEQQQAGQPGRWTAGQGVDSLVPKPAQNATEEVAIRSHNYITRSWRRILSSVSSMTRMAARMMT